MAPLDEVGAWRHILGLPAGTTGRSGPLRFEGDGRWSSDGPVAPEAAKLLDIFAPLRIRERLVIGQLGQSLDGRIATTSGHSHYVNGPEDIERLHRVRALVQAVVVGAGTAASDDPRLTVRHVEGPSPVRVVLDPRGRLDPGLGIFTDGAAPTLWLCSPDARPAGVSAGTSDVEVVCLPVDGGLFAPGAIIDTLAERGLLRILVEGGGRTVSGFLAEGALDRLHVTVAPLIIGSGRPSFTLPEVETLDEALRPPTRHFRLGDDLLFDLDLRATGG